MRMLNLGAAVICFGYLVSVMVLVIAVVMVFR